MPLSPAALADRGRQVSLLVLDVDGVLTDGVIAIDDNGVETKHFHVRDGSAISLWRDSGRQVAILSGRKASCVEIRARELRISPVVQGVASKLAPFRTILEKFELSPHQVAYVGDDLADLAVLSIAGFAACPGDAADEVREIAHYVADADGGRGAVREIVELLLKIQGDWDRLIRGFSLAGAT